MDVKKIVTKIILIFLVYCLYNFIVAARDPSYLDCGEVVSKSADEVAIKRGVNTRLYLNVQFNKSGFRSVSCNPTTYFSKKVGDNVCFELERDFGTWHRLSIVIGLILVWASIIGGLTWFIIYLID